jgi:hypothetical protein
MLIMIFIPGCHVPCVDEACHTTTSAALRTLSLLGGGHFTRLSQFNYQWAQRDSNYRSAFGALQREGVSAVYVTYERLMEQVVTQAL